MASQDLAPYPPEVGSIGICKYSPCAALTSAKKSAQTLQWGLGPERRVSITVPDTCVLRYKLRPVGVCKNKYFIFWAYLLRTSRWYCEEIWDILDPGVSDKDKKREVVRKVVKTLLNKKRNCLEGSLKKTTQLISRSQTKDTRGRGRWHYVSLT